MMHQVNNFVSKSSVGRSVDETIRLIKAF